LKHLNIKEDLKKWNIIYLMNIFSANEYLNTYFESYIHSIVLNILRNKIDNRIISEFASYEKDQIKFNNRQNNTNKDELLKKIKNVFYFLNKYVWNPKKINFNNYGKNSNNQSENIRNIILEKTNFLLKLIDKLK